MAVALPDIAKLVVGTSVQVQHGVKWSVTMDGGHYGRDLFAGTRFNISARFEVMTEADAETLETFLLANRTVEIILVIRQYIYHAYMTSEINRDYIGGDGIINMSATFNGVRVA